MAKPYYSYDDTYTQPTAGEIRSRARSGATRARAKGKELHPIVLTGRTIAKNWWGVAWCNNLEQYADFASRIDRGKRYVRSGAVLDLQIQKGRISARVQGSRKVPYKVEIRISPLSEERCQQMMARCAARIENLEALTAGSFPHELQELFTGREGLFPTPREISFSCSCPDWALMCKHVAAALYGVGVRLDEDPLLFFELRGLDVHRFVDVAVANKVEAMLEHAKRPSSRIIESADLTELFGVL